jgi:hypothetical protein
MRRETDFWIIKLGYKLNRPSSARLVEARSVIRSGLKQAGEEVCSARPIGVRLS